MLPEKRILSFADASRKVIRSREVERPGPDDLLGFDAGLKAKDLVGLLMRHWPARRVTPPRCRIGLRVLAPSGKPAVKIRCQ
jgi:hypothetical protein